MNQQSARSRAFWTWILMLAFLGMTCYVMTPRQVVAQDDEGGTDAEADTPTPAPKATGGGDKGAAEEPVEENLLIWLAKTSGIIGLIILALSIYFVATAIRSFMELRPEIAAPPAILEECENLLKQKDFMGMYKLVKKDTSFFSTVMAAGLAELPQGLAESRDAMERVADALVVEMERKISMLAVLGTLGPMIGLLGTLMGMIESFGAIARSGTQLKTSEVAGGISKALVLTLEGVGLSVPAIYFFALFRNRISSISTSTLLLADEFIRRVNTLARAKSSTAPAGAPTT